MGWGASKVLGVWLGFHTIALGLIEVLRYWSQVRACGSFWSTVFRDPGPDPLDLWLRLPGTSAKVRVVGCGFGPCLDIDTLHVFKIIIFFPGPLHYGQACTE